MRELSVAEQRYQAVLAVISDGLSVSQVAEKVGVSRQTLHSWLARYEASGLDGLVDRSHRPVSVRIKCQPPWRRRCWSCADRGRIGGRGGWCSSWLNGADTFLSSGAGFMTITTDNTMLVSFPLPNCVQLGGATAEQSNAFYSLLPNSVNTSFTQAFQPLTAL
jgi:hypothetical protein